ncbi:MAG: DUF4157 domain-containing protein [Gammaproteobacteria bacterium]
MRPAPKQKSARAQHSAYSRFGFANPVCQTQTAALPTPSVIQTKLKIGEPDNKFEEEADRVAEQVMRMPDSGGLGISESAAKIQRKCAACPSGEGLCPNCTDEEQIQRKPLASRLTLPIQRQSSEEPEEDHREIPANEVRGQTPIATTDLESNISAIRGGGRPLPPNVRAFFEARFSYDFSQVRIDNHVRAAEAARLLNAQAFTVGHDIVFGVGQYAPATSSGRWLLAHELTHVMQQEGSQSNSGHTQARGIQRQSDAAESDCVDGRILRWGCDTVCSHNGFWDHTLSPAHEDERCCNMWPPFVEEFARQTLDLNGTASCRGAARRRNNHIATVSYNGRVVRALCTDAFGRGRDHEIELSPLAMRDLHGSFNNIRSAHVCYEISDIETCSEAHDRRGNRAHPEEEHCISNRCVRDEAERRSCRVDFRWPSV